MHLCVCWFYQIPQYTIISKRGLPFSAKNDLRCFYRASNAILNTLNKPNDEIQMQLLYTNCVPILTHASAAEEYESSEFYDCNTALNNAFWKIFSYNRWEGVRSLRESFGYSSLTEIFEKFRDKFLSRLRIISGLALMWIVVGWCF